MYETESTAVFKDSNVGGSKKKKKKENESRMENRLESLVGHSPRGSVFIPGSDILSRL